MRSVSIWFFPLFSSKLNFHFPVFRLDSSELIGSFHFTFDDPWSERLDFLLEITTRLLN